MSNVASYFMHTCTWYAREDLYNYKPRASQALFKVQVVIDYET